jgi:hypothetical protein
MGAHRERKGRGGGVEQGGTLQTVEEEVGVRHGGAASWGGLVLAAAARVLVRELQELLREEEEREKKEEKEEKNVEIFLYLKIFRRKK